MDLECFSKLRVVDSWDGWSVVVDWLAVVLLLDSTEASADGVDSVGKIRRP